MKVRVESVQEEQGNLPLSESGEKRRVGCGESGAGALYQDSAYAFPKEFRQNLMFPSDAVLCRIDQSGVAVLCEYALCIVEDCRKNIVIYESRDYGNLLHVA